MPIGDLLSLCDYWNRNEACQRELLDASVFWFQRSDLGCVKIAFGIDREVMQRPKLPGIRTPRSESVEVLECLAVEDQDLRLTAVGDVQ